MSGGRSIPVRSLPSASGAQPGLCEYSITLPPVRQRRVPRLLGGCVRMVHGASARSSGKATAAAISITIIGDGRWRLVGRSVGLGADR